MKSFKSEKASPFQEKLDFEEAGEAEDGNRVSY